MTENTQNTASAAAADNASNDNAANGDNKRSRGRGRGRGRGRRSNWSLDKFQVDPAVGKRRFHDFDLQLPLMRGIHKLGFEYCSPIQAQSLPYTLNHHDVVGKAQTGTGKTAAFLISIINDLLNNPIEGERYAGEARALIMAPTRELAIQIAEDAEGLTRFTKLGVHTLVGGMEQDKQRQQLRTQQADIVVGTPGRMLDFATSRDLLLDQVEILVIDEADRMLDMGFIPQVRRLVRMTPKREERQTLLFSATFTPEVDRLIQQWTEEPAIIEIQPESVATNTVDQRVFMTTGEEKFTVLQNILNDDSVDSCIVFANRRDICRDLHAKLRKLGFKAGLLSGDVPQQKRVKTLDAFKKGELTVMVATDVAGRGIHVEGLSHVVNYTLPEESEDYVHRIGRTGRAGRKGMSISFACEDDAFLLEPIQKLLGVKLECEFPPASLLREEKPEATDVPTAEENAAESVVADAPAEETASEQIPETIVSAATVSEATVSEATVSEATVSEATVSDTAVSQVADTAEAPVAEEPVAVKPEQQKIIDELAEQVAELEAELTGMVEDVDQQVEHAQQVSETYEAVNAPVESVEPTPHSEPSAPELELNQQTSLIDVDADQSPSQPKPNAE